MKLSIITINFNNKTGLQRTIDSVISQTFKDFEWIVIDGGSTDGSKELIEQYADHYAYWVSEPDKGIYNAMNKGIKKAEGDWLQFLNSGDWLYEDTTLEKVFSKEYDAAVLYGDTSVVSSDSIQIVNNPDELTLSFLIEHAINHQSTFYFKQVFDNRSYDETYRLVSDWLLSITLILNNYKFYHLPIIIVNYDANGVSSIDGDLRHKERSTIIDQYIPYHIKKDIEKSIYFQQYEQFINKNKVYIFLMSFMYRVVKKIDYLKK